MTSPPTIRLGLDIGGTFTDVALEVGDRRFTAKTLTTARAPEEGVVAALRSVTGEAGVERVLELLRVELFAMMQQVGAPTIKDLKPAMVQRV